VLTKNQKKCIENEKEGMVMCFSLEFDINYLIGLEIPIFLETRVEILNK